MGSVPHSRLLRGLVRMGGALEWFATYAGAVLIAVPVVRAQPARKPLR